MPSDTVKIVRISLLFILSLFNSGRHAYNLPFAQFLPRHWDIWPSSPWIGLLFILCPLASGQLHVCKRVVPESNSNHHAMRAYAWLASQEGQPRCSLRRVNIARTRFSFTPLPQPQT
ncbi:hypothetical protein C2E23DRAFT_886247 [Lenzites betulinus]|nr:hypothetical protein C2E23DRAFT_886247 [Lenzites betulinus]